MPALRFEVHGRVQGVGFRWWARQTAVDLGLVGRVRNEVDGSVVILASGPTDALDALRTALHRGPPGSRVIRVDEAPTSPDPSLDRFVIETS